MKFSEFDIVVLLKDYPNKDLRKGDEGTIVMVYTDPNEAYEVEFVNADNGETIALLTLHPSEIKIVKKNID